MRWVRRFIPRIYQSQADICRNLPIFLRMRMNRVQNWRNLLQRPRMRPSFASVVCQRVLQNVWKISLECCINWRSRIWKLQFFVFRCQDKNRFWFGNYRWKFKKLSSVLHRQIEFCLGFERFASLIIFPYFTLENLRMFYLAEFKNCN